MWSFTSQINIETDGRWLATSHGDISDLGRENPIESYVTYNSHNLDTSTQAYSTLACFTKWLELTTVFTNKK